MRGKAVSPTQCDPRVSGSPRTLYRNLELPYGIWICADGREVLFNRYYQPIWQRRGLIASPIDRHEYIAFDSQQWFYTDRDRRCIGDLQSILAAFRGGRDLRQWLAA